MADLSPRWWSGREEEPSCLRAPPSGGPRACRPETRPPRLCPGAWRPLPASCVSAILSVACFDWGGRCAPTEAVVAGLSPGTSLSPGVLTMTLK